MKILISDDDFVSRRFLKDVLSPYGDCDIVVDGEETLEAVRLAFEDKEPYDLIFLDIMMPRKDGQEVLKEIRQLEKKYNILDINEVKVVMITALGDMKSVFAAYYKGGATSYLVKPVTKERVIEELRKIGIHSASRGRAS